MSSFHRLSRWSPSYSTKEHDVKLTRAEMEVLWVILQHVGGDPEGARGRADSVNDKLRLILRAPGSYLSGANGRLIEVQGSLFLKDAK
jgi:hypothetical protein